MGRMLLLVTLGFSTFSGFIVLNHSPPAPTGVYAPPPLVPGAPLVRATDPGAPPAPTSTSHPLLPRTISSSAAADPYALIRGVAVGSLPYGVGYDSGVHDVFVSNANSGNVSVISETTSVVVANVTVPGYAAGLAYDPAKGEVYVADGNLTILSDTSRKVVGNVTLGPLAQSAGVAYDSGKGELFVTDALSKVVYVVNDTNNSVVARIATTYNATGIVYDSGKGELFDANFFNQKVTVFSDTTNREVAYVTVGAGPYGLTYDPALGKIFVSDSGTSTMAGTTVSVILDATNLVVSTVPVGSVPIGIAYAAGTGDVFVANEGSDNLTIISATTDTTVGSVSNFLGAGAYGLAWDSTNHGIYVADGLLNLVSIFAGTYGVAYTESGLPSGASWVIYFNGTSQFGTVTTSYIASVPTITASLANGTYAAAVRPYAGYRASISPSTATVAGGGISGTVTFSKIYQVAFSESGLPVGTHWSVTLNGTPGSSTSSTITFNATNGTYSFTVAPVGSYIANVSSGSTTVAGSGKSISVSFAVSVSKYTVTFQETGLVTGTTWSVTLNGTSHSAASATITFSVPNGTYAFAVGAVAGYFVNPPSGSVAVTGGDKAQAVVFSPVTYTVNFNETGLPSGTTWSVTLGGVTKSSATATISFAEPDGSFTYSVGSVAGYTASPGSGSLGVNGAAVSQSITFSASSTGSGGSSSGLLGLPGSDGLYVIIGIVVVAAAAVGAFALRARSRPRPPATPPESPEPKP